MRVLPAFFTLLLLLTVPGRALADQKSPVIDGVTGSVLGNEALVRFTLQHAFSPEMVEALKSGIEISFKANVYVEKVQNGWFNETVGKVRYSRTVRYDALSRVYRLHRDDGNEILPDIHAALDRMTRFEVTIPLSGEFEKGKSYRAYVRVRLDRVGLSEPLRSFVFFSSLWDVETDWARGYLSTP